MRILLVASIALLLYGTSQAKNNKEGDGHDKGKQKVTVIEQRPSNNHVVIVRQPPDRSPPERIIIREEHPSVRIIIREENDHPRREEVRTVYITDDDDRYIREYYREDEHHRHHHKHHKMRPEWRERLIIGRCVPRDVEVYEVPVEIERRLPPLPNNYIRFMVGTSLFVKDARTNVIVDAHFNDIF